MQFAVHAKGSGKRIKVNDRIGGGEVFNGFVDPDQMATVNVASNDGLVGDVDIEEQMRADAVWVVARTDYAVAKDEVVDIDDV